MRQDHVVTASMPPFMLSARVAVHLVPVWRDNLVWLLVDQETGEAAAVDGPEPDPVLETCERLGVRLTTILNTHTHPDHIGINYGLQHSHLLDTMRVVAPRPRKSEIPGSNELVWEGDTVDFADLRATVLVTEGHLDGHISYLFDGALFCGDTLYGGGCGYLFSGPAATMYASLMRFASLPEETLVCCAHEYTEDNLRFASTVDPHNQDLRLRVGDVATRRRNGECTLPTTIGLEKRTNPFLRVTDESVQRTLRAHMPDAAFDTPTAAFAAMRRLKDSKAYKNPAGP